METIQVNNHGGVRYGVAHGIKVDFSMCAFSQNPRYWRVGRLWKWPSHVTQVEGTAIKR